MSVDITVDQKPMPQAPVDPNVTLPDHVKRAAEKADSYFKQPDAAPAPSKDGVQMPLPSPAAPPSQPSPPPSSDQWEHRYHSMKGRHDQSQEQIRALQLQVNEMGSKLGEAYKFIEKAGEQPQVKKRLITPEEERDYGTEFLNVVKKAASEELVPEVTNLKNQVTNLQDQLKTQSMKELYQLLDNSVPKWSEINRSQRFANWLALRDPLTGAIRRGLLNAAFQAVDAPRVAAFFKGFISDEAAIGSTTPGSSNAQPPAQAPRQAAMDLSSLVAPGRASSAPSSSSMPAEKPVYTRADISQFYKDVRTGLYAGRDNDKLRIESDIFAAQREGRVKG